MVTNLPAMRRPVFNPWVGKIPWRREWLPTPIFFPGEFHGPRNLAKAGDFNKSYVHLFRASFYKKYYLYYINSLGFCTYFLVHYNFIAKIIKC